MTAQEFISFLSSGNTRNRSIDAQNEEEFYRIFGGVPTQARPSTIVKAPILTDPTMQLPTQLQQVEPATVVLDALPPSLKIEQRPYAQGDEPLPQNVSQVSPQNFSQEVAASNVAPQDVSQEVAASTVAPQDVVQTAIRNEMVPNTLISQQMNNQGTEQDATAVNNVRPAEKAPNFLERAGSYLNAQFRPGDPDFLQRLGNGLAIAGSQDPFKALMMLRAQEAENQKIRQARIKAMQGETKPLGDNGVMIEYNPDGSVKRTYIDEVIARAAREAQERQLLVKKNTIDYTANVTAERDQQKAAEADKAAKRDADLKATRDANETASKAAEAAIPILNDVKGLSERWKEALKVVGTQSTAAQLQGVPLISGIAGFFGGDEVAKNKFLEGLTVDETLLNTARTKGAISNQEMTLFKSPIPSLTDDREKVWKPWIEKRLEVLTKLEKFYEGQVSRSSSASSSIEGSTPAAAQRNGTIEAQLKAANKTYDPKNYDYRIGPNGEVQSRKK